MAFKVIIVDNMDRVPKMVPADAHLPLLIDEEAVFEGPAEIVKHLNDLEEFKNQWYKFQSDVCYCDDDGNVE